MRTVVIFPADQGPAGVAEHVRAAGGDPLAVDFAAIRASGGLSSIAPALVAVVPAGHPSEAWLAADPAVAALLHPPLSGASLRAAIRAARAAGENESLLEIGRALSSERDPVTLQQAIVREARRLTGADAGSLYVLEDDGGTRRLRFSVAQTGPLDAGVLVDALLPLSTDSIAGYVVMTGESVRIDDAYAIDASAPYTFNRDFDDLHDYRTRSVLCVPMRNVQGRAIGALQLINRDPQFDAHDERLLTALASQAAVAMENARLVDSIQHLFERFVHASVKAIEVRDKATQGHSARVALLTVAQAEAVNAIVTGPLADVHFSSDQIREMRYAALLHDFGKVAVPEYIFAKAKKLPDGRMAAIRLRFLLAIEQARTADERADLEMLLRRVEEANEPNVVADAGDKIMLRALDGRYRDTGTPRPILEPEEYDYLSIPRGSLSDAERERMQDHVTQSFLFLREIPWHETPWKGVADLAYGHHEHLDGTGYPRKLRGDAIALPVRMMTIADVYDALTAADRPYKKGMAPERALDILHNEFAQRGKIDPLLLDVFTTQRLYEILSSSTLSSSAASSSSRHDS